MLQQVQCTIISANVDSMVWQDAMLSSRHFPRHGGCLSRLARTVSARWRVLPAKASVQDFHTQASHRHMLLLPPELQRPESLS